jgi:hypothetical protein
VQPPPPYKHNDALVFIDDGWSAVMVRVVDGTDPSELLPSDARGLADALIRFADALDEYDADA